MAFFQPRLVVDTDSEDEMLAQLLQNRRKAKRIRPRRNNFDEWDEEEFSRRFRLSKATTLEVLEQIENRIEFATNRNSCLPAIEQLLLTLRYYATAGGYTSIGDFSGVHKSTAGRVVNSVTSAIASLRPIYVNLPVIMEDIRRVQLKFYDIAAFPRVVGALDCTHVRIKSPGGQEAEHYRNRKGYFSFNVQTLVDADLVARDVVARWPGSSHDSTIYNHSRLRARLEGGQLGNGIVLCDSAYAVGPHLLPPLQAPQTREEQLYNEAQIRTRNVVERFYGVWKARFPILSLGMNTKLHLIQDVIVACAVLHNIARKNNEEVPPLEADIEEQMAEYLQEDNIVTQLGEAENIPRPARESTRRTLIQYFRNRLQIPRVE